MTDASFCEQRTIMQLYNRPLPRFDLNSINPYLSGKYTKSQLDMRRKTEILKYSPARVSTQTNNLTKKQKFAMLAKGTYVQPQQSILSSGNVVCPADEMIMTPTSASGVPGPVKYLYNDETVPLYNFASFNLRSYPDYVATDATPWQFVSQPDVSVMDGDEMLSHYLILYNSVAQPEYTYTITIPVGLSVSGTSKSANLKEELTLEVLSATLRSYYNKNLYGTYSNPTFDSTMSLVFDVESSKPGPFRANYFVGNMTFSGVRLYTSPTFVYSFMTEINLSLSSTGNTYDSNIYFGQAGLAYRATVNMSTTNPTASDGPINVLHSSGTTNNGSLLTWIT